MPIPADQVQGTEVLAAGQSTETLSLSEVEARHLVVFSLSAADSRCKNPTCNLSS